VRIIKPATLAEHAQTYPNARGALSAWQTVVKSAHWRKSNDVQRTYSSADIYVTEKVKRTLFIFDICGGAYRLICGMRLEKANQDGTISGGIVYIREFLTHAEYNKGKWKVSNDKN
jgi:mRNA interferase HigB